MDGNEVFSFGTTEEIPGAVDRQKLWHRAVTALGATADVVHPSGSNVGSPGCRDGRLYR